MTNAEVAEILARAERATLGPWVLMDTLAPSWDDHGWRAIFLVGKRMVAVTKEQIWGNRHVRSADESSVVRENNLAFSAHARTDVPNLARALQEARADLKELMSRIDQSYLNDPQVERIAKRIREWEGSGK